MRARAVTLAAAVMALAITACGGGSATPTATTRAAGVKPIRIIPGPAGLRSAGPPQPNGTIWTLSGSGRVRTLQALSLATGDAQKAVGAPASATAVGQSTTGLLALGLGTASTGAVDILNGANGTVQATVPVGAPVRALAFGNNGVTVYALDANAKSASVTVIDAATHKVTKTVPVPLDATALVPSTNQTAVWTVQRSGTVQETSLANGRAMVAFPVGDPGIGVAITPSGSTLYVLKGTAASANIAVVNLATESIQKVLPAAAHSVGLQLALNGSELYDVVGAGSFGNIQLLAP
ncbi:YncE family protein [Conexibacter sp. DBS9H8]|uniref:YncE family protein n=1 Tax=Conexibacter sp. DBS9H8 TaxID=2937801 RepID=UPI00200EE865|nr:YncE family protein [Conexibacter sp. DBS9H8]